MLLIPGTVALLAGCIGFGAIMVIPIDMVRELAITATVGVALTILTDLVLLPVLLSYTRLRNLERKREFRLRQLTRFDRVWAALSRLSKPGRRGRGGDPGRCGGVVLRLAARQQGDDRRRPEGRGGAAPGCPLQPGRGADRREVRAGRGHHERHRRSRPVGLHHQLCRDGADRPLRLAHGERRGRRAGDHAAGRRQDRQRRLERRLGARWRVLPRDPDTLRQATQSFETDSGLLNADCSAMPITIFTSDHQATTIDRVVAAVKDFREKNNAYVEGNLQVKLAAEAAETPTSPPTRSTCAWPPAMSASPPPPTTPCASPSTPSCTCCTRRCS
ncbi:hypothetical protein [Arenimonas daejeonensis]|uniref:hypothetical protein n=1 Tax=Arenimonas daejeonensis TaxID=370777 RepID=UPI001315AB72|nr:hypothetical protein [Arenimonas daejeonensis]